MVFNPQPSIQQRRGTLASGTCWSKSNLRVSCRIWKLGAPGCADKKIYERDINGIKRFGEGLWKLSANQIWNLC